MLPQPPEAAGEDRLAERFRAGDAAAFDRIVTEHRRAVYLMARRLLGSHEDADEAAQVAFLRAWQGRTGFRGDAALRTWLIRIVLNVAKTMRARQRDGGDPRVLERLEAGGEATDEGLRRRQLRRRVRRAVAELPPRQREVVLLKTFGELTHREVATLLSLSEGAVKAHLHQAIANLRRAFAAAAEEP